jgi:hypothetical protein
MAVSMIVKDARRIPEYSRLLREYQAHRQCPDRIYPEVNWAQIFERIAYHLYNIKTMLFVDKNGEVELTIDNAPLYSEIDDIFPKNKRYLLVLRTRSILLPYIPACPGCILFNWSY